MSENAFIDVLRQLRAVVQRQYRSRADLANFYAGARLEASIKGMSDPSAILAEAERVGGVLQREYGQYDHEWVMPDALQRQGGS
jgi:hypothetical protein